ncbi:MAG TPA: peptidylprolyl isomerase [Longimicrobiales bacterium]|nr:peptidylprolyl isomerase [Longimicrobiales bacterium]
MKHTPDGVQSMPSAKAGDTVRVHYTGKLEDGSVFDSSDGRDPLEFTVGTGQVIPGFEAAVSGMSPGEERSVTIPATDAYGDRKDDLVIVVDRTQLPPDIEPSVGQQLQLSQEGRAFVVTIADVTPEKITLDANHPLAGEDLTFDLELVGIE